jgi:hypothetical protein
MSFCPDKPILAGFLGSFAPYPFLALAGHHDDKDVICLTQHAVNNAHTAIKSKHGGLRGWGSVAKNGGFERLIRNTIVQISFRLVTL